VAVTDSGGSGGAVGSFVALGLAGIFAAMLADGIFLAIIAGIVLLGFPLYGAGASMMNRDWHLFWIALAVSVVELALFVPILVLFHHHDYTMLGHIGDALIDILGWLFVLGIVVMIILWFNKGARYGGR
jgi:hypothetical protein